MVLYISYIFHCKTLQNLPKLESLVWKYRYHLATLAAAVENVFFSLRSKSFFFLFLFRPTSRNLRNGSAHLFFDRFPISEKLKSGKLTQTLGEEIIHFFRDKLWPLNFTAFTSPHPPRPRTSTGSRYADRQRQFFTFLADTKLELITIQLSLRNQSFHDDDDDDDDSNKFVWLSRATSFPRFTGL
jgi:hypothetical protein